MTYKEAQEIKIGDIIFSSYTTSIRNKGDKCVVIFKEEDFPKFTIGEIFNFDKNEIQCCNFQSFNH